MAERLTFEQREGLAELPSQLQPRTLSKELRALLWEIVFDSIDLDYDRNVREPWRTILRDRHVRRLHRMVDQFDPSFRAVRADLGPFFEQGGFGDVMGFVEFVLRHPGCPRGFWTKVEKALRTSRAAYRLVDGDTIAPIASEAEGAAMSEAIEAANAASLDGARRHLKQAASFATAGNWGDSVRESIHAVESIAVTLDPAAATTLGPALKTVAERTGMHPALREALSRLYGYTCDESGIRHALLEGDANVDETDALFMLGACSSFVTFLIAKSRSAGLLSKDGA